MTPEKADVGAPPVRVPRERIATIAALLILLLGFALHDLFGRLGELGHFFGGVFLASLAMVADSVYENRGES